MKEFGVVGLEVGGVKVLAALSASCADWCPPIRHRRRVAPMWLGAVAAGAATETASGPLQPSARARPVSLVSYASPGIVAVEEVSLLSPDSSSLVSVRFL